MAPAKTADPQARQIYISFAILSVILIVVTIWLTRTADVLQDHPIGLLGGRTLGATFVGVFFLAAATSLPEIVTSITAVRIGQVDLALGNIFGSNMFNIAVIPILKVFSLLNGQTMLMDPATFAVRGHTIAGLFAILITGVAVAGLVYRTKRRLFHFGIDSVLIGVIYLVGMYVLLR
jgi:cation:H+ antiporter